MEYLTAKQTIGKLKQGKVTDISEAYFSQLVKIGAIPNHTIPGKKRKLYLYDEVKYALANIQDPSRDPQREAVKAKKEANAYKTIQEEVNAMYKEVIETFSVDAETYIKGKSLSDEAIKEIRKDIEETKAWNKPLVLLIDRQKENIQALDIDNDSKKIVMFEVLKTTVIMMTTMTDLKEFIEEIIEEDT